MLVIVPPALIALLYGSGYLAQFIYNYDVWSSSGGNLYGGTAPAFPDADFFLCLMSAFRMPYGLYGLGICLVCFGLLILMVMKMGAGDKGEYASTTARFWGCSMGR